MQTQCFYKDLKRSDVYLSSASRLTIPIGLKYGNRYVVDTLENCGNLLIAGCAKSGKTNFLEACLRSLCSRNDEESANIYVFSNQMGFFDDYRRLAPVRMVTSSFEDLNDVLKNVRNTLNSSSTPCEQIIVIDEIADALMSSVGDELATRLYYLAKEKYVHLLVSTEIPSVFDDTDESDLRSSDNVLRLKKAFSSFALGVQMDSKDAFTLTGQNEYPHTVGEWKYFCRSNTSVDVIGALVIHNEYSINDEVDKYLHPKNTGKTRNTQYLAWEHCHSYFYLNREKARQKGKEAVAIRENMELHLTAYLATAGMYKASTFLQRYCDYTRHARVVEAVLDERYEPLWDFSPLQKNGNDIVRLLFEEKFDDKPKSALWNGLAGRIERAYTEDGFKLYATDTLVSTILLGIFGCIPCYDAIFRQAVEALNDAEVEPQLDEQFSAKSFKSLCRFALLRADDINKVMALDELKGKNYTPMKVLSAYLWQTGVDSYKKSYKRQRISAPSPDEK